MERKRTVGTSYRALRPQGIDFVDEGCHGIGMEFRKAVGVTKIRPQDGRPLGIIKDGGLGSGIERIEGRRAMIYWIYHYPICLVGLGADS